MSRGRWAILLGFLFLVMCAMIAWAQWYALHVNVPRYEQRLHSSHAL
ncbi:MAG TPA: hypothetical protein VIN40_03685 [Candidatus Tyrphobacter sp.]